jgi:hypothetical protein
MAGAATARKPAAQQRAQRNARALERARNGHRGSAAAATRTAPAAPRRKSGPVRRPAPKRTVAAPRTVAAQRAVTRVAQGSATLLLDSILRGRAWVALVGALLAGIVFLNVSVLELNRGIASTSARTAKLERANSRMRGKVADLGSAERIQSMAEARGYILPLPGEVTYLRPNGGDARRAAARIGQSAVGSSQSAGTATTTAVPATTTAAPVTITPPTAAPQTASAAVPQATAP